MNEPNHILNELQELSPTLAAIPRINVFSVPEGYFESLPAIILLQSGDNMQVAKGSVPEGYFDGLADAILGRIKEESNAGGLLAEIGNSNPFTVPEGYFENLPGQIMALVKDASVAEETSFISPLVAGIGTKNVFSVPKGYFENFTINLEEKPAAKLIQMKPRSNAFRYAAAAVVTGILAVSSYFLVNNNRITPGLSAEAAQTVKEGVSIAKSNSFDTEMNKVSDADIVSFLESNGEDVDAALVASLTDDTKSLPEATDYIIDEKTLDDMLKDLDLN